MNRRSQLPIWECFYWIYNQWLCKPCQNVQ